MRCFHEDLLEVALGAVALSSESSVLGCQDWLAVVVLRLSHTSDRPHLVFASQRSL